MNTIFCAFFSIKFLFSKLVLYRAFEKIRLNLVKDTVYLKTFFLFYPLTSCKFVFFSELKTVLFVAHSPLETNGDSFLAMIWAKRFQDGSPPLWRIECPISKVNPLTFPGFSFNPWPSETQPKFCRSQNPHFGIFGRGCLLRTSQEDNQIRGLGSW